MGRPKLYADAAAKHRAYRKRLAAETKRVDRRAWALLEEGANGLAQALIDARAAGHPAAQGIVGASTYTILDSLTEWFKHWDGPENTSRRATAKRKDGTK